MTERTRTQFQACLFVFGCLLLAVPGVHANGEVPHITGAKSPRPIIEPAEFIPILDSDGRLDQVRNLPHSKPSRPGHIPPRISQPATAAETLRIAPAKLDQHSTDPEEQTSTRSIQDIDFAASFSPIEQLPDKFEPQTSILTHRDPYLGASATVDYYWTARNLSHRTLYFQDMPLERYGYRHCLQPVVSTLDFVRDVAVAPLRWGKQPPCQLHYVLGLARPGSETPPVKERWAPIW